jgi:hypothetical protein
MTRKYQRNNTESQIKKSIQMEAFKEGPRLALQIKCPTEKHTVPSVCTNDSVSKPLGEVSVQTNSVIKVHLFFVNL